MAIDKKEVKVVGMHCPSCAKAVELCMMDFYRLYSDNLLYFIYFKS